MLSLRRHRDLIWPVAIFLAATAWVAYWGLHVHALTIFDERLSVEGARELHAHPDTVLQVGGYWQRGIERLTAVVLWPLTAIPSTERQFEFGHVLMAAIYGASAFPVWSFLRGMKMAPRWAALATATCLFVPWAVWATTFLNTALATTLVLFALWFGWRSALAPSWRWDLLALAGFGAAGVARVSYGALVFAWFALLLLGAVREADGAETPRRTAALALRRFWRQHTLVAVLGLLALVATVVLLFAGIGGFAGSDYGKTTVTFASFRLHAEYALLQLACATAVLPAVLGLVWLVRRAVRPTDREASFYAVSALAAIVLLLIVNSAGGFDDRYQAPALTLVLVAFFVALERRDIDVVGTLIGGAVVWFAMSRHAVVPNGNADLHLYQPAQQFFSRAIANPLPGPAWLSVALAVLVATAVALALRTRSVAERPFAAAVGVVVAAFCLAGSAHELSHFTDGQRPDSSFSAATFVDRAVGGSVARPFVDYGRQDAVIWDEVRYFNARAGSTLALSKPVSPVCCSGPRPPSSALTIDPRSGAVSPVASVSPYLLQSQGFRRAGLATEPVRTVASSYESPVSLVRVIGRPRATYLALGSAPGNKIEPGHSLRLRVFSAGARAVSANRGCLVIGFATPKIRRQQQWTVGPLKGHFDFSQPGARVELPLAPLLRDKSSATVPVRGAGEGAHARGASLALTVVNIAVSPCDAAADTPR